MIPADLLANSERQPSDRPAPSPERIDSHPGYWLGSATSELRGLRERAERAERLVAELRRGLSRWRFMP